MVRSRKISTGLLMFVAFFFASKNSKAQMEFIENKGQWHSNVNYRGDFNTGSFFIENKGFTVLMHDPKDVQALSELAHGHNSNKETSGKPLTFHSFVYKVKFLGASSKIVSVPDKPLPTYNNYYLGNDRKEWAAECKLFQAVTYKNVYPGIDVRYYSADNKLKYDFIVHPGANVAAIAMQYDGPTDLFVKDKELNIVTPVSVVKELFPYTYQSVKGTKKELDCKFVVRDNIVTFQLKNYDPAETLIIDPSIIFSSFSGSTADNWGYTATPGPDGSFFAGGIAFGAGYKVSPGAYNTVFNGGATEDDFPGYDIAIFKFSPNGSNRLYATYLGGSGNEQPHSMIVDGQGNLIVAGRSFSGNYPTTVPAMGPGGGFDIVITKFNAAGSALLGSVKIGGSGDDGVNIRPKYRGAQGADGLRRNYGDDARSEVILDAANNIILASSTQASGTANFPVTPGTPIQSTYGGGRQDGVILKFNSNLSTLIFGSYFGGAGDDACFVASINPSNGNIYIGGGTTSTDLRGDKSGVIHPSNQGGLTDGFVTIIDPNGSGIIKTTYLGTGGTDLVYGLKFDRLGFPYVMGTTTGAWPIQNASYSNSGGKQFISKLQPNLSGYVYSTVFGSGSAGPNISPIAFLVDRCENVYVSGWGGGINTQQGYSTGNTNGLPEKNPLTGIPAPDGADFYFFVLERNASSQLFGSHFGQFGGVGDHVDGGTSRFDENGVIYQAMCANCGGGTAFPTTPGSWSPTNGSNNCNQAAVKIEMNFAGVGAGVQASINSVVNDTSGCVPLTVDFRDTLQKGKKFYWSFGDGTPTVITTTFSITHTFNSVGNFLVMLIAEDSSTCNIRDTTYKTIRVGSNKAALNFTYQKLPPCENLTMRFTNTSSANAGNFGPKTFVWDYGDGSPRDTAAFAPPRVHTYASAGEYQVTLILFDTAFCNSPDLIVKTVRISPFVKAAFRTPTLGCSPYTAFFDNVSEGGTDFIWNFGDNTTSTDEEPTHVYANPGTYNVTLVAIDTNTCNRIDTSEITTVRVFPKPTAAFTWSPNPPTENTPVSFTNLSSPDAIRFLWNFGDGETSTERNPVHQYNETGRITAELIAYNEAECTDTFRLAVDVIIVPLLDVPNAFTPGKFGENGYISVKGFGIGKFNWRIYNRWGQLIFQTTNRKLAWDGTFKGKLQPMDVYAYTLDVEFTDGKKLRKTGDITLLR
ncbi:MAG: PKD domain-containing protein [Ferruginibacter sp.]